MLFLHFVVIQMISSIISIRRTKLEEDSYALANKLDASTERQNLNPYRKVLIEFNQT